MDKFLLISFSFLLMLQANGAEHLKLWQQVFQDNDGRNEVRIFERELKTPDGIWPVGQMTFMTKVHTGDESIERVKTFLITDFKLTGLFSKKIGDAFRFEGYQANVRRQVVVFVSFQKSLIKVST